uniref:Uncharacterized protein n=1 Tax=viral metagenome TaxID=1070528 RepID=A0A6M3JPT3_9ZZZZ
MPTYRQIHTKIWKDAWFLDLDAKGKLLFIYLFSNERSNLAGLYDISPKVMAFETDIPIDGIRESLAEFSKAGKVYYEDGWIWIPKLLSYNARNITSPSIQAHLKNCLAEIPDMPLKAMWTKYYTSVIDPAHPMDTVSGPMDTVDIQEQYQEQYQEQEQEEEQEEQEQEQEQEQKHTSGADAPGESVSHYDEIRDLWISLFPDKPTPRKDNGTLQGKVKTRMKSAFFRAEWASALQRAARSTFLSEGGFFDMGWFLKNDDNWQKCLNGNYDDNGARPGAPASPKTTPDGKRIIEVGR